MRLVGKDYLGKRSPLSMDGASSVWTPASLTGLVAWYKADAGVTTSSGNVTQVLDQSGNGYTLTNNGTVPLNSTGFNGYPAFDFIAANNANLHSTTDAVSLSGSTGSVFICGQLKTSTDFYGRAMVYNGNGQANDYDNAGSAAWLVRDQANNGIATYRNGGPISTAAISLATNYRLGIIYDGSNAKIYVNNAEQASPGSNSDSFTAPGTIYIGNGAGGGKWDGPIAEIVITSSAIGSGDRTSLDNYFKSRFGL